MQKHVDLCNFNVTGNQVNFKATVDCLTIYGNYEIIPEVPGEPEYYLVIHESGNTRVVCEANHIYDIYDNLPADIGIKELRKLLANIIHMAKERGQA